MSSNPSLTESNAYSAFKKVRNRLRKYHPGAIIARCVSHMNGPEATSLDHRRHYTPHLLLLLVKWTYLYGDFRIWQPRPLTDSEFNRLVNLMHDFDSVATPLNEYDHPNLLLRNLSFQQFYLQRMRLFWTRLARQNLLFGHLDRTHPFRSAFFDRVGVDIEHFGELALGLATRFIVQHEPFVTEQWFSTIREAYPRGTIDCFLSSLSLNLHSARDWLQRARRDRRRVAYDLFEESPLKRYPLLKHGDKYFCYHPVLLLHALAFFVHDRLRSRDPSGFMDKFGPMFEKYVEASISYTGLPFLTEKALRGRLGSSSKVVDFLILDGDVNVFVDAKAVEMPYLGQVTSSSNIVRDKTKSSVLKAISQGYSTAERIASSQRAGGGWVPGRDNYLIIVTFKDLYVGTGRDYRDTIAPRKVREIVEEHGRVEWIPLDHVYSMSVDDFDIFLECGKSSGLGLAGILRGAVAADSLPETRKWVFAQHVLDVCPKGEPPAHVSAEGQALRDRIAAKLGGQ